MEKPRTKWYDFNILDSQTMSERIRIESVSNYLSRCLGLVLGNDILQIKKGDERHVFIYPGLLEASIAVDKDLRTCVIEVAPSSYDRVIDRRSCRTGKIRLIWMPREETYNPQGDDPIMLEFVAYWNSDYGFSAEGISPNFKAKVMKTFMGDVPVPMNLVLPPFNERVHMIELLNCLLMRKLFSKQFPAKSEVYSLATER